MERRRFPVGIESFEEIRENGFVYVDKTELIHDLIHDTGMYFLSRPRRFGKSLLLSTVKAYFEGRRDLFEGLAISRHEHSWEKHPVFHFNLVNADTTSEEGLKSAITQHLEYWEKEYGVTASAKEPAQRFYAVIRKAVEDSGHKAVVLIDECDKPLTGSIEDAEPDTRLRAILKPLY